MRLSYLLMQGMPFNSLNRHAVLLNIHNLCPSLAIILTNYYQLDVPSFIGDHNILSLEGTTYGDHLAMVMYAIGIVPLIHHLDQFSTHQVWYADYAVAVGKLSTIRSWWEELQCHSLLFGYCANPTKSWLIVEPKIEETAHSVFVDTDINISFKGHQYLGSPIGSKHFIYNFIQDKISDWVTQLEKLTIVAQTQTCFINVK